MLAARGISDTRPDTFKSGATIFKALEELGLKLEQIKAPAEYLVIDHAERPRPDSPADDAVPPARALGAGRLRPDSAKAPSGSGEPGSAR